jgi:hypothetical protein
MDGRNKVRLHGLVYIKNRVSYMISQTSTEYQITSPEQQLRNTRTWERWKGEDAWDANLGRLGAQMSSTAMDPVAPRLPHVRFRVRQKQHRLVGEGGGGSWVIQMRVQWELSSRRASFHLSEHISGPLLVTYWKQVPKPARDE